MSNNIIIIKCSPSSWHVPAARRRLLISRSNSLVVPKVMIRSFVRAKQPLSKWARGACRMAHTYEFDRDTSVELVEKPKKIAFRHSKGKASIIPLVLLRSSQPLSDGWSIAGAPNGGLLVAMAISAMRKAIKAAGGEHHDPLTITCHFLSKSESGVTVDIPVEISKIGRKFSSVKASFIQDGNATISFLGTFGSLKQLNGTSFNRQDKGFNTMPKLSDCPIDLADGVDSFGTLPGKIKLKVPEDGPFVTGFAHQKFGGKCLLEGHGGFKDGRPSCLRSLGFFADAFPPPVLNYEITKWVPTVELTIQFFRRPQNVNDLLPVRFYNEFMENGMSSTLGEIYDSEGNLLAVSRQLCMSMTS